MVRSRIAGPRCARRKAARAIAAAGQSQGRQPASREHVLRSLPVDLVLQVLERVLRPAFRVREDASVLEAVSLFKREPAEMALVLDANGAFAGVATREDLLEAIAGDMPDSGRPQPVA